MLRLFNILQSFVYMEHVGGDCRVIWTSFLFYTLHAHLFRSGSIYIYFRCFVRHLCHLWRNIVFIEKFDIYHIP